jgi:hypothetical protein
MGSRRLRLGAWSATVLLLLSVAVLAAWVWVRGEMADHGLWRTLAWSALGLGALAFLYPRKRP